MTVGPNEGPTSSYHIRGRGKYFFVLQKKLSRSKKVGEEMLSAVSKSNKFKSTFLCISVRCVESFSVFVVAVGWCLI